jgi:predicted DCC family thiol-disulfide oxidoreductase YuxK
VDTTIVLYDGVCGLCDRWVQFLLSRDAAGRFRFAPLQGELARDVLLRRGHNPDDLDTIYVIAAWDTPRETVLARSRAILHALGQLEGGWPMLARLARVVPVSLADAIYRFVARRRYRVFGKRASCAIPPREWIQRFTDRSSIYPRTPI